MAIVAHYSLSSLPHKEVLLWWQKAGLQFTRSGYGRRIPTHWLVQLPGSPRWRRVYCCIFSNSGTAYVTVGKGGDWAVISN